MPTPWPKLLLVSAIGGLVFTLVFQSLNWVENSNIFLFLKNYFTQFVFWVVLWSANEWGNRQIDRYISWVEYPFRRFIVGTTVTIILSLILIVFLNGFFSWLYFGKNPLAFLRNLQVILIFIAILITAVISMFLHARAFLQGWRESILEAEKLKQAHIGAQYETLKNQVNPHFLFNSLNVLSGLVYKDQDLADQFIQQLSTVYRYVLDMRDKEIIPLEKELAALNAYIFLMKIRFGKNLIIEQNISPEHSEMIVPLTLQMLLENAIKHNEISNAFPLEIHITRSKNGFISIKNRLQKKKQLNEKSGIGLENIQARYQYISKKQASIIKTDRHFEVKVPILNFE